MSDASSPAAPLPPLHETEVPAPTEHSRDGEAPNGGDSELAGQ